ncbi:MAG: carbamoyltransferase HypF [Planctomycetia bacterium]|nr:carbamoyltransferase HypF [Planctomycetia bacterium]
MTGKRLRVRGLVQGVGFRPTVWHLAKKYNLSGQVLNDGEGVSIDIWGITPQLEGFIAALASECPPLARIDSINEEPLNSSDENYCTNFKIIKSRDTEVHTGIVPDAASCHACIVDTTNPDNRRYRYPFSNCTHCGPRLSIIDAIPYDRKNTSMAAFKLCKDCQQEYDDPSNRRFHAQPNACPVCGPRVWLEPSVEKNDSLDTIDLACSLIQQGKILAIKGLGGFHLACDATNQLAVARLRRRKQRYEKPFALMARDITAVRKYCLVNEGEASLLASSQSPIVLLDALADSPLAPDIAPGQKILGFMLPYTPLHHLLLQGLESPIVMTSGNISELPQCIDNDEAITQLAGIADHFLLHDRGIRNRVDDSVARIAGGRMRILRRARGYSPGSIPLPAGFEQAPDLLALGAELKNTFCLIKDGQAILSQHMGDLENAATYDDYVHNIKLYTDLYLHSPTHLAIDAHPEYLSSKLGRERSQQENIPLIEVQHHHAHIAACLIDNDWPLKGGKVLGVALDGLGFGSDGHLWGGEFLLADYLDSQRLGSFKPVAMPGGSLAMREPWRNTYAHLISCSGKEELQSFSSDCAANNLASFLATKPVDTLDAMMEKGFNAPLASSCGRLFDAVAAAIDVCREHTSYEGQAAIELEALLDTTVLQAEAKQSYSINIKPSSVTGLPCLDPAELWHALLNDLKSGVKSKTIAARFHLGLANGIIQMVKQLTDNNGIKLTETVALSGGVFQNRILFEHVSRGLENAGFIVLSHSGIPANDGGIALGQAAVALAQIMNQKEKYTCA